MVPTTLDSWWRKFFCLWVDGVGTSRVDKHNQSYHFELVLGPPAKLGPKFGSLESDGDICHLGFGLVHFNLRNGLPRLLAGQSMCVRKDPFEQVLLLGLAPAAAAPNDRCKEKSVCIDTHGPPQMRWYHYSVDHFSSSGITHIGSDLRDSGAS